MERVKLLLANGEDINALDTRDTALHISIAKGHKIIAKLLIARGADLNAGDVMYNTPLHLAVIHGHQDIVELLIAKDADLNAVDSRDNTLLHLAVLNGHLNIAKLLIAKGVDIHAKSREYIDVEIHGEGAPGNSALHFAAKLGHKAIAELLVANGLDVKAQNNAGNTPLHFAAYYGHKAIAELLIAGGADATVQNTYSETPLFVVTWDSSKDREGIIDLLTKHGASDEEKAICESKRGGHWTGTRCKIPLPIKSGYLAWGPLEDEMSWHDAYERCRNKGLYLPLFIEAEMAVEKDVKELIVPGDVLWTSSKSLYDRGKHLVALMYPLRSTLRFFTDKEYPDDTKHNFRCVQNKN